MYFSNKDINEYMMGYLARELEAYGDIRYAYAILNKKNTTEMRVISNNFEWFELYVKNNYQHIDPVIIQALNRITSFSWDENIMINLGIKMPKIFNMIKEYDITHGYTFVVHDHKNNLALLSIMVDKKSNKDLCGILNDKDKLQCLLINVHDKILSIYSEIETKKNKYNENKPIFSPRENEILYWSSMGKTYQETAMILGIKLSTVKFHMGNVVKKLGVMNAKHAIRLGTELQIIRPILSQRET